MKNQMTLKITEQNGRVLARRWAYSKEKKRSMPTTVYADALSRVMETKLPKDVIKKHNVTKEEQEEYTSYVTAYVEKSRNEGNLFTAKYLSETLKSASSALLNPELADQLTLEQLEILSERINEVKKIVTSIRNKARRKNEKTKKNGETI